MNANNFTTSTRCKSLLTLGVVLCSFLSVAYADSKNEKPIVPCAKNRLVVLGDHWVYDINYRTPKNKNDSDEGPIASLFNIGASDNFQQVLDLKVVSVVKLTDKANDITTPDATSDTTDDSSSDPHPDDPPVNTETQTEQSFGKDASCYVLLCNLKYKKDGKDYSTFAKFMCLQDPHSGRFGMDETTSRVGGFPGPSEWAIGSQWVAYFPYSLLRLELQPQSAVSLIVDKERIKTRNAVYDTWKVSQSAAQQAGYIPYTVLNSTPTDQESTSDIWYFDPSIVFPVKADVSYTNGAQWSLILNKFEAGKPSTVPSVPSVDKK